MASRLATALLLLAACNAQLDDGPAAATRFDATLTTPWSTPQPLAEFNTVTSSEEDPWLAADESTFVFASDSSGNKDIYISTR